VKVADEPMALDGKKARRQVCSKKKRERDQNGDILAEVSAKSGVGGGSDRD